MSEKATTSSLSDHHNYGNWDEVSREEILRYNQEWSDAHPISEEENRLRPNEAAIGDNSTEENQAGVETAVLDKEDADSPENEINQKSIVRKLGEGAAALVVRGGNFGESAKATFAKGKSKLSEGISNTKERIGGRVGDLVDSIDAKISEKFADLAEVMAKDDIRKTNEQLDVQKVRWGKEIAELDKALNDELDEFSKVNARELLNGDPDEVKEIREKAYKIRAKYNRQKDEITNRYRLAAEEVIQASQERRRELGLRHKEAIDAQNAAEARKQARRQRREELRNAREAARDKRNERIRGFGQAAKGRIGRVAGTIAKAYTGMKDDFRAGYDARVNASN